MQLRRGVYTILPFSLASAVSAWFHHRSHIPGSNSLFLSKQQCYRVEYAEVRDDITLFPSLCGLNMVFPYRFHIPWSNRLFCTHARYPHRLPRGVRVDATLFLPSLLRIKKAPLCGRLFLFHVKHYSFSVSGSFSSSSSLTTLAIPITTSGGVILTIRTPKAAFPITETSVDRIFIVFP